MYIQSHKRIRVEVAALVFGLTAVPRLHSWRQSVSLAPRPHRHVPISDLIAWKSGRLEQTTPRRSSEHHRSLPSGGCLYTTIERTVHPTGPHRTERMAEWQQARPRDRAARATQQGNPSGLYSRNCIATKLGRWTIDSPSKGVTKYECDARRYVGARSGVANRIVTRRRCTFDHPADKKFFTYFVAFEAGSRLSIETSNEIVAGQCAPGNHRRAITP